MAKTRDLTFDEILKLKAAALYIVDKCGIIDYFHIFKILYFADKEHYSKYGRRIVKDTFCAMDNGPVPSVLYDSVKISMGKKNAEYNPFLAMIAKSLYPVDQEYAYFLSASEKPDLDELSVSDIECLDKSINENKDLSFSELSKKSHDYAWKTAYHIKASSEIDNINIAISAGANDAMIEYIKENELIDSLL